VGGVAGRQDGEVARRIVAEVSAVIEERERRFRELGVDTMTDYRRLREQGRAGDDPFGDVFLVVDGWSVLRQDFEELEMAVLALVSRSLTYGVHIIGTANRWLEFRLGLRDLIGTKLELKLGDALDSEVDRKMQQLVPSDRPGRGVTPDKMQFLAAVPRIDHQQRADDLGSGVTTWCVPSPTTGTVRPRRESGCCPGCWSSPTCRRTRWSRASCSASRASGCSR